MTAGAPPVQLGLIGDNIAASRAPRLHEWAGAAAGIAVRYDRLVPAELGLGFAAVFDQARRSGFRGLNITYPYKERAVPLVRIRDARVAQLGAVNTVLFSATGPEGHNTDWSGFIAGYRRAFGAVPAGEVCMVGAGGVGRAVAFGLLDCGLAGLRLVERDLPKAQALAEALLAARPGLKVMVTPRVAEGCAGADGLVNCTPVGMVGHDGTPIPPELMPGARWAFDAVYTPVNTRFLSDAAARGLAVMSGEALFFYQGLHAFALFHGRDLDEAVLRAALASGSV